MTEEKKKIIEELLADHVKWLQDSKTGKRLEFNDDLLKGYELSECDLSWVKIHKAHLEEASREGTSLEGAYFSDDNPDVSNLSDSDLKGADFSDADLEGAIIK